MIRAFVDASVLYAALVSTSGASRELLRRHVSGQIELVVSPYVLEETRRNLAAKQPDKTGVIDLLLDVIDLKLVDATAEAIKDAAQYTTLKDAPVVAAARAGGCDYLLTFDKKHLLGNALVATQSGSRIITPGDLIQHLRKQE